MNKFYKKNIDKLKGGDMKVVISNFLSLSVLQGLNMFLPLLTIPYLVKVIGLEKVGLLSFATAFITYFQILTDYGFNLTATRDISQNIENKLIVNKIFNDVFFTKFFLLIISIFILIILVFTINRFREDYIIYFLSFGVIIGLCLFPVWFFQGIQEMKYITYINLIAKLFFTITIFLFVKEKKDFWLVPLLTSLGYIISGIVSLIYACKKFDIVFKPPNISSIKNQMKRGRYVFLSQVKISLFNNTNTLILGFISGNMAVGYFSSADKIIKALSGLQIPVVNALYPYFSKKLMEDKKEVFVLLKKVSILGSIAYLFILLIIFVYSNFIVKLLFGEGTEDISIIIKILILVPLMVFLNNLFGTQILLNLKKDRLFFFILLFAAVLNLSIIFPLTYKFSFIGTSISVLVTEFYMVCAMYIFMMKERREAVLMK